MEIHIKIKDVLGQDERGRHIIYVDENDLLESLMERKGWLFQEVDGGANQWQPIKI